MEEKKPEPIRRQGGQGDLPCPPWPCFGLGNQVRRVRRLAFLRAAIIIGEEEEEKGDQE